MTATTTDLTILHCYAGEPLEHWQVIVSGHVWGGQHFSEQSAKDCAEGFRALPAWDRAGWLARMESNLFETTAPGQPTPVDCSY